MTYVPIMGGVVESQLRRRLDLEAFAAGHPAATGPATGGAPRGRYARSLAEVWGLPSYPDDEPPAPERGGGCLPFAGADE